MKFATISHILLVVVVTLFFFVTTTINTTSAATQDGDDHSVLWGAHTYHDKLIRRFFVVKKAQWFFKQDGDLFFEIPRQYFSRITAIHLIDQLKDGHAHASLVDGGVNYNFTKIHFESDRFNGFNYIVDIYGE